MRSDAGTVSSRPPGFFGRETVREIVVVVVSILIAFGLDAWWDGVASRRQLREQLEGVLLELEAGRSQLAEAAISHRILAGAATELRNRLEQHRSSAPVAVPDTLVGGLFSHFVMDVGTSATTSFVDAGGLALIEDPDLAARLRDWPAAMDDAIDDQAQVRSGVQSGWVPYMLGAGDLGRAMQAGSDMVRRAHGSARGLAVPPFETPPRDLELTPTPELLNLLSWRVSNEETRRRQMEGLLAAHDTLVAQLRAVLDD